ncbi:MAG: hypothetical protein GY711_24045 [bacterium]|nr:hypothetical protein [bacterium]
MFRRSFGSQTPKCAPVGSSTCSALHRHLERWLADGWLVRESRGRATRYRGRGAPGFERGDSLRGLEEDAVWRDVQSWLDRAARTRGQAADAILAYVVTELVNNAIDHSGAHDVSRIAGCEARTIRATIRDEGVGALENLRSFLHLEDHLQAPRRCGSCDQSQYHRIGSEVASSPRLVARTRELGTGPQLSASHHWRGLASPAARRRP